MALPPPRTLARPVVAALDDLLAHPTAAAKIASGEAKVVKSVPAVTTATEVVEEAVAAAAAAPLRQRFPVIVGRILGSLRAEGVPRALLPTRYRVRRLVGVALELLGDRRIAALDEAELAALVAGLRRETVLRSPALAVVLRRARGRARTLTKATGAGVRASAVDMDEGVWVFVHTTSPDPVVLAESFAPRRVGVAVPARPGFPGSGTPRWLPRGTKEPVAAAPPPPSVVVPEFRAGARLLAEAPVTVVEQMRRAELHRIGRAWVPLTPRVVAWVGEVPAAMRRTLGTRIRSVRYEKPTGVGHGYDTKVVIEGHTGPGTGRFPDTDALPLPRDALGAQSGMERCHAWGFLLGDSTPAGMGYCSKALNQAMLRTIEEFLRSGERGRVALTVTSYLEHRPTLAGRQPFLRTVVYRWTDAGVTRSFEVGVEESGRIFTRSAAP